MLTTLPARATPAEVLPVGLISATRRWGRVSVIGLSTTREGDLNLARPKPPDEKLVRARVARFRLDGRSPV